MGVDKNVMRAADLIANSNKGADHIDLVAADLAAGGPHSDSGRHILERRRPPSLAKELRGAKKAGMSVKGATIEAGRITLTFGDASDDVEVNEWDRVLR